MLEDTMIHGSWPRWPGPARIEHDTPIVPHAVASAVWEEACAWLGEELPHEWRVRLMERAEAVYASNARVRRRLRSPGNGGRDWLWTFMRHWLAALLWHHRSDLHARLPDSFTVGHPLFTQADRPGSANTNLAELLSKPPHRFPPTAALPSAVQTPTARSPARKLRTNRKAR